MGNNKFKQYKSLKPKEKLNKNKKQNNVNDIKKFKERYFDFYDDIKDYTKGKEDW